MKRSKKAAAASRVLEYPALSSGKAKKNLARKLAMETDPSDVHADLEAGVKGFVVLDARSAESYAKGHVPGAIHLWHREITAKSVKVLNRKKLVVTYCTGVGCNASTKAAYKLAKLGFKVKEMVGGLAWWEQEGYSLEQGAKVRES